MQRGKYSFAVFIGLGLLCCEPPVHPKHEGAGDELCGASCSRQAACDRALDRKECVAKCESQISPRAIYYSETFLTELRACSERQSCSNDVKGDIRACEKDVRDRLAISPAAQAYCEKALAKDHVCGTGHMDTAHCSYNAKIYSDAILGQLSDCLDDPCKHYGRCTYAVLGEDRVADDRDRQTDFKNQVLAKARDTVGFSGKVVIFDENDAPIAGAKLCVVGEGQGSCTLTDDTGKFAIVIPAAKDLAITVDAPKPEFAPFVFGLSAKVKDATGWTVGVSRAATLVKRFAKYGMTYPNDAVGFMRVGVSTPKNATVDLSSANATITPTTGHGPFSFANAAPDASDGGVKAMRAKNLYFSDLAPGTVEITIEPSTLSCTPSFGALSSGKPNTVRAPVLAGYETGVYQRCGADADRE